MVESLRVLAHDSWSLLVVASRHIGELVVYTNRSARQLRLAQDQPREEGEDDEKHYQIRTIDGNYCHIGADVTSCTVKRC